MLETVSLAVPVLVLVALWVTNLGLKASAKPVLPVAIYAIPLAGIALAAVANTFVIGDAGLVGVVTRFRGVTGAIFEQGFSSKIPFAEPVWVAHVRTQKEQGEAADAARDLQEG